MKSLHDFGKEAVVIRVLRIVGGLALAVCLSPAAHAVVYKCMQGGKTTFSDVPCEAGAAPVLGKSGSAQSGGDNSPKGLGVQTCGQEAEMRYGSMGRVEIISVGGGQMEVVSYAGTTLPARRFSVNARVWTSPQGSSGQNASFTCFTSEDGRRILKDVAAAAADGRPKKDGEIAAPRRDDGLSESRELRKGKSIRDKEIDDLY